MINKHVLDNGLRIVYEKIPYLRSVSIGIWVGTGSRNENTTNNGISHFIEHMLFKGTRNRTAKDIAVCIDSIGGQLNAFTGKEYTCYYAKVLDTHIETAMDLLQDMFFNSVFNERDISVEKQVIIEEINMHEDTPEELVHEVLARVIWDGDPLGYTILGTRECLERIDKEMIKGYIHDNYTCSNTVISVAGNFDENELINVIGKHFGSWKSEQSQQSNYNKVDFRAACHARKKETEQVHMCMGFEGFEHGSDDIYPLLVINNILGGGISSRLFQNIREEKGLVYSIYSYPSSYKNTGLFAIYAGMNPGQLKEVVRLIAEEIENLVSKGIDEHELGKSKEQLKGNYMLGLESTNSRMNSIGKSEVLLGYVQTPEEILEKIEKVKMDDINRVLKLVFDLNKASIAAVGTVDKDTDLKALVKC
ncbi:MAG: insulinase family protein [Clostridiaceae bacterium]|nr:insulinase family protein [Clostridiaceae bacterium]